MEKKLIFLFFLLLFYQCKNSNEEERNRFPTEAYKKISEFKDRHLVDSLVRLIHSNENPDLLALSALAFGSLQDSRATDALIPLLTNPNPSVRQMAAFSLGQIKKPVFTLASAWEEEKNPTVKLEMGEALGKVAVPGDSSLSFLLGQEKINHDDTSHVKGLLWAFYRMVMKPAPSTLMEEKIKQDIEIARTSVKYLTPSFPLSIRILAGHIMNSLQDVDLTPYQNEIFAGLKDPSPKVRMPLAGALGKIHDHSVVEIFYELIHEENDYLIRTFATYSLSQFSYHEIRYLLFFALADQNINVRVAAGETLLKFSVPSIDQKIYALTEHEKNWRVRYLLKAFLLKNLNDLSSTKKIQDELIAEYHSTNNLFKKRGILMALGEKLSSFNFLKTELLTHPIPAIQSASASALVNLNKMAPVDQAPEFLNAYILALDRKDPASTDILCEALRNPVLGFKEKLKDLSFLRKAREHFTLPRDAEVLQSIDKTIAYLEGTPIPPFENPHNHNISWALIQNLKPDQKVLITTTKGPITIQLLVHEAPGSVANFLDLMGQGYYDSMYFHRVVPHFVVQAGCKRGDGWGGENYSLRSEFYPRHYKMGSVGMASSGKDTEGTQWFITRRATPHLDGRYTIFAEVHAGMDVVHALELGDQILQVKLLD